jgi:hypothetical protein
MSKCPFDHRSNSPNSAIGRIFEEDRSAVIRRFRKKTPTEKVSSVAGSGRISVSNAISYVVVESGDCIASVGNGQILEKCYSFVDIFERDLV